MLYLLIDCNSFFVSCEQIFRPDLLKKAVVVLSSNDGCVVSRSKEAKPLIPMGVPIFQYEGLIRAKKVVPLSSNFALYHDISKRVMQTLTRFSQHVEIYSIDEAFLQIDCYDPLLLAKEIQTTILKEIGIPTSIGIGPTKTLAKIANDLAKKKGGILYFDTPLTIDHHLKSIDVGEIWGIGRKLAPKLHSYGLWSGLDLKRANEEWILKKFSQTLLKTVQEIRGICRLEIHEEVSFPKSITCSRLLAKPSNDLSILHEALSSHISSAGEKLFRFKGTTSCLVVFMITKNAYKTAEIELEEPTFYTPLLIEKGKALLETLFEPEIEVKKVGVTLLDLKGTDSIQSNLFETDPKDQQKQKTKMHLIQQIKRKYGKKAIWFGAEGVDFSWKSKSSSKTPNYTTSWEELLCVQAK